MSKFVVRFLFEIKHENIKYASALEMAHSDAEMMLTALGCTSEPDMDRKSYGSCVRDVEARYIKTYRELREGLETYLANNGDKMGAVVGIESVRQIE